MNVSRILALAITTGASAIMIACSVITAFSGLEGSAAADASTKNDASATSDGSAQDGTIGDGATIDASRIFPDGSSVFPENGHAYQIITLPATITWENASAFAIDAGGHLATLTTIDENSFAVNMVVATRGGATGGNDIGPWFGAYQPSPTPAEEPDGGWAWVTGEPWSFQDWYPGEPNNDGNENWGCFEGDSNAGWNDCEDNNEYVYSLMVEYE